MRLNPLHRRRNGPANDEDEEHRKAAAQQDQQSSNDQEKQEERQKHPVGFWDRGLKDVRNEAFGKWILTTTILMIFILLCLCLYWGVFYNIGTNLPAIVVYVVDFDGQVAPYTDVNPIVGPMIRDLVDLQVNGPLPHLGWTIMQPADFNYDPIQVRQAVYDWDAWAAIIVNANATAMLQSALQIGNASYDPLGACQLIYQSARDQTTWFDFLSPYVSQFQTAATTLVGGELTKQVLANASFDTTLLANAANAPQALSPAIGFSMFDLRPFNPYTTIPAVSIGLIYLIIMAFFSFSWYLPIHQKYIKPDEGHPVLKFWQQILWRWFSTISAYFMLSLAYSLVSLALQINFHWTEPVSQTEVFQINRGYPNIAAYGDGTFPVYWMLNFFGMIALGLACENMAMIVGQPWVSLWLIFWVITNVSTAFYNIDIEPSFYRWGYVWPLHYVVEGSRQILFDLHQTLALDFGVLIVWGAINTAVFPCACYFMRWKSKNGVNEYYK